MEMGSLANLTEVVGEVKPAQLHFRNNVRLLPHCDEKCEGFSLENIVELALAWLGGTGTTLGIVSFALKRREERRAATPNISFTTRSFSEWSEAFVEIHNRLDEDIRLHAIIGNVPFFNYSFDAPGNRTLLGTTADFNERIAAGEKFDVKVGLNSPDVEELTFVISSAAGTLRKRKFKVERYD